MGNRAIRQLMKPKRLFAANSDHRHKYEIPVLVEIYNIDNTGILTNITYRDGTKCSKCNALLVNQGMSTRTNEGLPVIRLKNPHRYRIDLEDLEPF